MSVAHPTPRLALAFLSSLLLFFACAGGASAASSKAEIKAMFRASTTESEVAACSTEETQRFLEQTTSTPGKRALKACEREARLPEGHATSVVVSHIAVRGRTATAHLQEEFSTPGNHVPAKFAACFYSRFRHASNKEITEYLFGVSSKPIAELIDSCLPDPS